MNKKISIIGIGNILMMDEGIGVHAVTSFPERYEIPGTVEIIDGGTQGLDLLPYLDGRDKVIVVDAVNFGRQPGAIAVIENDDVPAMIESKASLHHLGLADVLSVAKMTDALPGELCLIGIQPKTLDLGLDMTPEMGDSVPLIHEQIAAKLRLWEIPCALRSHQKSSR